MNLKTNRLDYNVEEMVAAGKDFLRHHFKDHNVLDSTVNRMVYSLCQHT